MASTTISPELKAKYQELSLNYQRRVRSIETILPGVATCLKYRSDLGILKQLRDNLLELSGYIKDLLYEMNDIRKEIGADPINITETLRYMWEYINKFLPHDKITNAKAKPEEYL